MATPNKYVQTNTFYLAGSGVIIGATSIALTSLTDIYGNVLTMTDFGTTGYITLEPDTTNEESATFTGVTANANGTYTLTGVSTTLAKSPYTQTSGLVRQHSGGTKVVVTDNVAFWNTFANKANDETITGQWTFSVFPVTPATPTATTSVLGMVKVSSAPASALSPIAVETTDPRVPVAYAVDSVGTDSYAITPSPAITAYTAGQTFTFQAGTANTGAATLNVNALGAKTIKKNVSTDLATGDILLNQIVEVKYDGTNMQLISIPSGIITTSTSSPTIQKFTTSSTTKGDATTQFSITNTSGSTYRYTWNSVGTDPSITSGTVPTGIPVLILSNVMNQGNTGYFLVTNSGSNFFEVTNAAGVVESNKPLTAGYFKTVTAQTYTAPAGLKYAVVEVLGAGEGGQGVPVNSTEGNPGGGAGAYSKKIISAATLGSTQTLYVGPGGGPQLPGSSIPLSTGASSILGALLTAPGGGAVLSTGGTASGGDININGGNGGPVGTSPGVSGAGGNSILGAGGPGVSFDATGMNGTGFGSGGSGAFGDSSSSARNGGSGTGGIIIFTEYYS